MRAKNSFLNLFVSVGAQGLNIILQFLSRYIFVQYFSKEYLGVNGLFTEILTIFSLAELGIGISMMYGLYDLISKDSKDDIACLMNLYRKMYMAVGTIVAIIGCIMLPFLRFFIKDSNIPHIYLIYLMYLANSVISYFFSYKQTLIRANQKEYIVSGVTQGVKGLQVVIQIIVIIFTQNFYLYLGIQIFAQALTNITLSAVADKKYPYIKQKHLGLPEKSVCLDVYRHIRAMAIHRFGSVFVFNTDNILISMFAGLGVVGIYSNYKMVINNLKVLADYIYNAVTASVGNLSVTEKPEKILFIYHSLNMGTSILFGWMSICLLVLFNPFIELFFGKGYLLSFSTVIIIVIDFYVLEMRQMTICFRNAMGLFWYDRYKPIVEVLLNLGISLALVNKYQIAGVILGTTISSLLTNFWVEPYVFFKYGIKKEWKRNIRNYFWRYGKFVIFTFGCGWISLNVVKLFSTITLITFVGQGLIVSVIYFVLAWCVFGRTKEYMYLLQKVKEQIQNKKK